MFAFHRAEARAQRTGLLQPVLAGVLAALLGACSSSKHPAGPQVFAWLQHQPPSQSPIDPADVANEGYELAAQTPPPVSIGELRHDPTAPWSANGGRSGSGVGHIAAVRKSPEEAGIAPEQHSVQKHKRAYLTLPLGLCTGWRC